MKKIISIFAIIAVAIFGFIKQPVRHNGIITFEQINAFAGGDSEDDDDPFPPPPPPGMPSPPPDSIPPYKIPVIYYSK